MPELIRKRFCEGIKLRVEPDKPTIITGYAALFDSLSVDLGGFRELIKPGAFTKVLRDDGLDVAALVNHNRDYRLARSTAGTLKLVEDSTGLRVEIQVPDTQVGRDAVKDIQNGNLAGFSFAFTVGKERAIYEEEDKTLYEVEEISRLYDVSVVDFPAYPETSDTVGLRDRLRGQGAGDRIALLIEKVNAGIDLTPEEYQRATEIISKLAEATVKTPLLDRFRAHRAQLDKLEAV